MRCAWVLGDRSSQTFEPLWKIIRGWKSFGYVTDGWLVYPCFINSCDHLILKTYMTRIEGENTRLRHYLARLKRKTLCYSKCAQMLRASIKLLLHYLHFDTIPALLILILPLEFTIGMKPNRFQTAFNNTIQTSYFCTTITHNFLNLIAYLEAETELIGEIYDDNYS